VKKPGFFVDAKILFRFTPGAIQPPSQAYTARKPMILYLLTGLSTENGLLLTLLLCLYTYIACKPESASRVFAKFFFRSSHGLLAPCVRSGPAGRQVLRNRPCLDPLSCLPVPALEGTPTCQPGGCGQAHAYPQEANVQKRCESASRKICTPSVQARYRACAGHRNARKPLSLWRKAGLSTVNRLVYYYYQFVYILI
jgi:hypothetical protein